MRIPHTKFLFGCLLVGCAAGPPAEKVQTLPTTPVALAVAPAPAPVHPAKPVKLGLTMEAQPKKGTPHTVAPGEVLRTGDKMAIRVEVDQPAYVYVALVGKGTPQVLFPASDRAKAEEVLVQPGAMLRVPSVPDWFELDRNTGPENVLVYAAREPIAADVLAAHLKADADRVAAEAPPTTANAAPTGHRSGGSAPAPTSTRGVKLKHGGGSPLMMSEDGVTTTQFSYGHQ